MIIYLLNVSFILLLYVFSSIIKSRTLVGNSFGVINNYSNSNQNKSDKYLLIFAFISLWIVLTFRDYSVGIDLQGYRDGLFAIERMSWDRIFNFSIKNICFNYERGFVILTKVFSLFSTNFTVFLGFISFLVLFPLYRFVRKYSPDAFLSIILFISFGFFHFNMSGLRQGIAISLALYAFDFLNDKKYLKFFIIILIGSTIHQSILFFAIASLLIKVKFTPIKIFIYYCLTTVIFIFRIPLYNILVGFLGKGSSIATDTEAYTLFFVVTIAFAIAFFFYKKTIENKNVNTVLVYNLSAIAATLMIFNTVSQLVLRVTNYFYIFMILLIPCVIEAEKDKNLQLLYKMIVISFVLLYYFIAGYKYLGTENYRFVWQ